MQQKPQMQQQEQLQQIKELYNETVTRLTRAVFVLYVYLRKLYTTKRDSFIAYMDFFLKKVSFTVAEVLGDESSALMIFSKINRRGKNLNNIDRLKPEFFKGAKKDSNLSEMYTKWDNTLSFVGDSHMESFFQTLGLILKNKKFEESDLQNVFTGIEVDAFLNHMTFFAKPFVALRNASTRSSFLKAHYIAVKDSMSLLMSNSLTEWIPLVTLLLSMLTTEGNSFCDANSALQYKAWCNKFLPEMLSNIEKSFFYFLYKGIGIKKRDKETLSAIHNILNWKDFSKPFLLFVHIEIKAKLHLNFNIKLKSCATATAFLVPKAAIKYMLLRICLKQNSTFDIDNLHENCEFYEIVPMDGGAENFKSYELDASWNKGTLSTVRCKLGNYALVNQQEFDKLPTFPKRFAHISEQGSEFNCNNLLIKNEQVMQNPSSWSLQMAIKRHEELVAMLEKCYNN